MLGSCPLIPHSCAPMCTLQRILHAAARFPGPVAVAAFNSFADVAELVVILFVLLRSEARMSKNLIYAAARFPGPVAVVAFNYVQTLPSLC